MMKVDHQAGVRVLASNLEKPRIHPFPIDKRQKTKQAGLNGYAIESKVLNVTDGIDESQFQRVPFK